MRRRYFESLASDSTRRLPSDGAHIVVPIWGARSISARVLTSKTDVRSEGRGSRTTPGHGARAAGCCLPSFVETHRRNQPKEKRSLAMDTSSPKKALVQSITSLIAGTKKNLPNGTLVLNGQSYTSSSLEALLQSLGDALAKSSAAQATWHDTLQQERALRAQVRPVLAAYTTWLLATYGSSPAILVEFGVTPRKGRAPLDAKKQAAASAKTAATRAARHTMGSKQKKGGEGQRDGRRGGRPRSWAGARLPFAFRRAGALRRIADEPIRLRCR